MSATKKILLGPNQNGAMEISRVLQDFLNDNRNYVMMRDKFMRFHDRLTSIYVDFLIPYAESIGFEALKSFASTAVAGLKTIRWPADPHLNDAARLTFEKPTRAQNDSMELAYSTLTNSHLTAFLFCLFQSFKEFELDLCEEVAKREFAPKRLTEADVRRITDKIQVGSNALSDCFNFKLDLSHIKSPEVVAAIESAIQDLKRFNWHTQLLKLEQEKERGPDAHRDVLVLRLGLIKVVRNLIIGVYDMQRIIYEPDIDATMLTTIIERMHDQEDPQFKAKFGKAYSIIQNSSGLLNTNMPKYYETYVQTNNAFEMSSAYIQDISNSLKDSDQSGLAELVNHYMERARSRVAKAAGAKGVNTASVTATLDTLQSLLKRVSQPNLPVSDEARAALDRVNGTGKQRDA